MRRRFFINGGMSIVSKAHQININALPTYDFLIWNYLFQFALSAICFCIYMLVDKKNTTQSAVIKEEENTENLVSVKSKRGIIFQSLLIAAAFSVISGIGFLLQLNAAKNLPASMLYPFVTGGSIILTALAVGIFYKEKIDRKTWFSLALLLIGTILFIF